MTTVVETSHATLPVRVDQSVSSHEAVDEIVAGSSSSGWTVAYIGPTTVSQPTRRAVSQLPLETRGRMALLRKRMRRVLAENPPPPAGPRAGEGFRTELAMLAAARGHANTRLLGDVE